MRNKIWLIILPIVFCCEENRISNQEITDEFRTIAVLDDGENKSADEPLFDDLELVFLETRDDILMAGCSKVEFYNDRFYVLDKQFSNLLAFDRAGKFLFRVGALGNGPGEYPSIYGFEIDEEKNRILVYSLDIQSILKYDLDGEFLKKETIDFYGYEFNQAANGDYVFNLRYNDNGLYSRDNIFVTNDEGKVQDQYFPYPQKATSMIVTFSGFYAMQGNVGYYTNTYSDTLYRVDIGKKESTPMLKLDLGTKTWPHGYNFSKIYDSDYFNYHTLGSKAFVANDLLFFGFQESEVLPGKTVAGGTPKMGILNLANGELITSNSADDEFLLKYGVAIPEGVMPDGRFVSGLGAGALGLIQRNYKKSWEVAKRNYDEFTRESSNVIEENNPALLLYKMRK